jgi:hypothetical protein
MCRVTDQDQDAGAGVAPSEAEVVQAAVVAQGDDAGVVDAVVADAVVAPSSLQTIHRIFPEADCLELNKSYRSTSEITEFAQRISRNDKLVPVSRHGAPPQVIACRDRSDEERRVLALVKRHQNGGNRSLGVICKTVAHARQFHRALNEAGVETTLLDYDSSAFAAGVVVTSAHISRDSSSTPSSSRTSTMSITQRKWPAACSTSPARERCTSCISPITDPSRRSCSPPTRRSTSRQLA